MNKATLLMVGIVAAVAMLSAAVVVVPIQQASAQDTDFDFEQRHSNECSGATFCANEGSIEFTPLE
jgi:hypothetical protein